MAVCAAKTRSGRPCKRAGMLNGRCKFHGGMSLSGPAHPNWRGGRHSKYLKLGLLKRYEIAVGDPDLISLRSEVALVDARIAELLDAIGETGNTRLWKTARTKFDQFRTAAAKGAEGTGEVRSALQAIDDVLLEGLTAASTWDELADRLELRRKLVESETKRLKDMHQMISTERAVQLFGHFLDKVVAHVSDPRARADIVAEFNRVVGAGDHTTPAT